MEILQIENLSFRYPGAETLALDAQTRVISFSAEKGLGKEELLGVILDHISADTAQE